MKLYVLPMEMVRALRSWFHPKDRSVILAPATFIEGEEIITPAHPAGPGNPAHNRGRLYWKNGCWTQLDEFGSERSFCVGVWQNWFPTITQGGAVAATTDYARYSIDGKTVTAYAHLSISGTGTAGTAILIGGLPVNIKNFSGNSNAIGSWNLRDASVPTNYEGVVDANSITEFFMRNNNTAGSGIGQLPNLGLASGDTIGFTVIYEAE